MRQIGFGLVAAMLACACSSSNSDSPTMPASGGSSGSAGGGSGGASGSAGSSGSPCSPTGSAGSAGAFVAPTLLSQTGLYSDIANGVISSDVQPFEPKYVLWSDGASKRRFIRLPACSQIDTSDMDFWKYPVGTTVWKEFTSPANGAGGAVRVETRMLEKLGNANWFMMAFHWNSDQLDAVAVPDGVMNASGTDHDIPTQTNCGECHGNMPDTLLGVTAIQLSHDLPGLNLNQLIQNGQLSAPPSAGFTIPGTATDTAALGYMHANCGHCHNPRSVIYVSGLDLALWESTQHLAAVTDTSAYTTTVGVAASASNGLPNTTRVVAGDASSSVLFQRFTSMDLQQHMPPLATEVLDATGRDAIEAWINSLP